MGRPYPSELSRIPATIDWAMTQDVSALARTFRDFASRDLLAIGSGGSFAAASFAALLHEAFAGRLARASTPLEAVTRPPTRDTAALLLSAGGTNTDIRRAAEMLLGLGYGTVSAVTTKVGSSLGRILTSYGQSAHEFAMPGGRDGFLATNSLIATLVLLHRAAAVADGACVAENCELSRSRPAIIGPEGVLTNRTLIVLAQGWAGPAAVDFESRFFEAAIANVAVTDPRNFAHGRHHWLSLHAADTGIVSFETQDNNREAARVLRLLPKNIDVLRIISTKAGPAATIELVRAAMELAGDAARSRGMDPGRPSVAEFGRRLYRAGVRVSVEGGESTWIARKRRALFLGPRSDSKEVAAALRRFVRRLGETKFCGLVIDYDGTLCARDRRFDPLEPAVCHELNRILGDGAILGIASGRGRSVHDKLRQAVDHKYWAKVVVGLYNGAKVVGLAEDVPESEQAIPPLLAAVCDRMRQLEAVIGYDMEVRPSQVSLRPRSGPDPAELRLITIEQLAGIENVSVVASSHSVDVIPSATSKSVVVDAVLARGRACPQDSVFRIGDQGAMGGNDFELLNTGPSLSVDRVSSNLETCWNLGAPGLTGPAVTLQYLRALRVDHGMVCFDTSRLLAGGHR